MAYSTLEGLARWIDSGELVRLCSSDPAATLASPEVVSTAGEAIAAADAEIDSHLLGRWPSLRRFDPAPEELVRLSSLLAVYNLYLRRRAVSECWIRAAADCRSRLAAAARGELSLGLDASGSQPADDRPSCRTDAVEEDCRFTRERLERF